MRQKLEYAVVWLLVKAVGALPRPLARAAGISVGWLVYILHGRLRQVGMRNLALAFPEKTRRQRSKILRGVFVSLGRQAGELCLFPKLTKENIREVVIYDGFENFDRAFAHGRGVLFLTAHLGAWELSALAHSLQGHPLQVLMRPLDNPYLDRLTRHYRSLYGNVMLDKDDSLRAILKAMRAGKTTGVLMDTNMMLSQGIFVDFFGIPACTTSSVARIALRTGAAVVPGFTIWDPTLGKYRLRFEPELKLIQTGDDEKDIIANTALFNRVIEDYVRRYPDQWLWVHRRWKTRPEGEPSLY